MYEYSYSLQMTLLWILFLVAQYNFCACSPDTITIETHRWCEKSMAALKIFMKAKDKYSSDIKFQTKIQDGQINRSKPLPVIIINCKGHFVEYENELTFIQFEYWIRLYCFQQIPACTKTIDKTSLQINIPQQNKQAIQTLRKRVTEYPTIKVCNTDSSDLVDVSLILKTLEKLIELPFFFKFRHNIRNQLVQHSGANGQICIMLITPFKQNQKNSKDSQFQRAVHLLRKKSNSLGYLLKQQDRNRVIFVRDSPKSKIIKKLLYFLGMEGCEATHKIIGFGFSEDKIFWSRQYVGDPNNYFVFWIQEILDAYKFSKEVNKSSPYCLSNQIIHFYQPTILQSLKRSSQIRQKFKQIQSQLGSQKIAFIQKQTFYSNQPQYKLCLQDDHPEYYQSEDEVEKRIKQKFMMENDL